MKLRKATQEEIQERAAKVRAMEALTEADFAKALEKVKGQETWTKGSEKQVAWAKDILDRAAAEPIPGVISTYPAWRLYLTPAQVALVKATFTAKEIVDGLSVAAVQSKALELLK